MTGSHGKRSRKTSDADHGVLSRVPSPGEPIDRVHLARQTLGDETVARQVLSMFRQQAASVRGHIISSKNPNIRRELAHSLVGSARGLGAFALADSAARLETSPMNEDETTRLSALVDEVHGFIDELLG